MFWIDGNQLGWNDIQMAYVSANKMTANDGRVLLDATDALLVLKHAAKLEMLDDDACIRAELDDNGNVDASDALIILKIAAKIIL